MDVIKNFKAWCHKVLPLVYDDSLSYYEFLCKVMKKLNEVIDAVDEIIESGGYDPAVITQIQEDITRLKNTVKTISEDLETTDGTVDTLEDTVGGLVDNVAAIEDALDTKVSNSDLRFNIENPQSAEMLENIFYNGQTYLVETIQPIEHKLSLRYEHTGTITQDTVNKKISMTIGHNNIPADAVVERAVLFGQYNTYFMQCELDFSDNGLCKYGPIKPLNDSSTTSFLLTKQTGVSSTVWSIAIEGTDNADTGLFTTDSDIYRVRFYYHIPEA